MFKFKVCAPVAALVALGIFGSAEAQTQDAAARRTTKVQARYFNPFDVTASRFTLNPFGLFRSVEPAASLSIVTEPAPAAATGGDEDDSLFGAASAVRVPYRPPVRSPYRPPPRPPFIP